MFPKDMVIRHPAAERFRGYVLIIQPHKDVNQIPNIALWKVNGNQWVSTLGLKPTDVTNWFKDSGYKAQPKSEKERMLQLLRS